MKNEKDKIKKPRQPSQPSQIKTINNKIRYINLKTGINRTKEEQEEIKINKYCRETNSIKTIGRKKYKHTYPTTSKMEWDKIEKERRGEETSERKYIRDISKLNSLNFWDKKGRETKEIKPDIPKRKVGIILESDGEVDFYKSKLNPYEREEQCIRIWKPENERKAVYIWVKRKELNDLPNRINTPFGEMETNELIKIAMRNEVGIYELRSIVEE